MPPISEWPPAHLGQSPTPAPRFGRYPRTIEPFTAIQTFISQVRSCEPFVRGPDFKAFFTVLERGGSWPSLRRLAQVVLTHAYVYQLYVKTQHPPEVGSITRVPLVENAERKWGWAVTGAPGPAEETFIGAGPVMAGQQLRCVLYADACFDIANLHNTLMVWSPFKKYQDADGPRNRMFFEEIRQWCAQYPVDLVGDDSWIARQMAGLPKAEEQAEDVKAEDVKAEDVKVEDMKAENGKVENAEGEGLKLHRKVDWEIQIKKEEEHYGLS